MFLRDAGRSPAANAPLAEAAGRITSTFEYRGNGLLTRQQRGCPSITTNSGMSHVLAGQQGTTSRRADTGSSQELCEPHALCARRSIFGVFISGCPICDSS